MHETTRRFAALVAGGCLLVGCAEDAARSRSKPGPRASLPSAWTLTADGITVEITRHPYGYSVKDGAGRTVLSTQEARGGGYAPVAWSTGRITWGTNIATKGQFTFEPEPDGWREGWEVVDATAAEDEVVLVLAEGGDAGAAERLTVRHAVRSSALRVEATLEGARARFFGAAFEAASEEGFLGFGERFNKTDQRGVSVYSWAEEGGVGTGEGDLAGPRNPLPNGEAMTYYPVPFFVSTEGYGFWLDTTWRSAFELTTEESDAWRVWEIGPSIAYEVYVPLVGDARPWPDHLVDLFTERTGRPALPPAWAFGPRRRISRGYTVGGVPEIEAMRDRDLAITAVDDSTHFLPKGRHVGIENELRAWVAEGHRLGYKVNAYYNSLFAADEDSPLRDVVQEGVDKDYFLRTEDGQVSEVLLISGDPLRVYQVDFTSAEATTWYQSAIDWAVDLDYDGFMYDFGEYVQVDVVASNGMTGEELHNLYPVLYDEAGHRALEAGPKKGDWLFFARSGYTGSSRWAPMVWSGDPAASFEDSDGLPSMIRAGVNAGVSGAPNWGGDIGGFHCLQDGASAADGELMTRWIQQGSMSPNMQDQNACIFNRDDAEKASIWTSADALEAWRTYARLHTRLFPYLWSLANRAHRTGAPIMRHLFFEHPDRSDLRAVDDEYYLGPSLLVAPVVQRGQRERSVLFPEGRYLDWRDERLFASGRSKVEAPLDKLPLFLRDGYLVPLLDPMIDTLAPEGDVRIVGRDDVAYVYDVVGLISSDAGSAAFTLADGGTLTVSFDGGFSPPPLRAVTTHRELTICSSCWRAVDLGGGLTRVGITHRGGEVAAGGLTVRAEVGRQVRWDLYLYSGP